MVSCIVTEAQVHKRLMLLLSPEWSLKFNEHVIRRQCPHLFPSSTLANVSRDAVKIRDKGRTEAGSAFRGKGGAKDQVGWPRH